MSKHTPGPYKAEQIPQWYGMEARFLDVTAAGGLIVAFIKDWGDAPDEARANQALFAAAPSLLNDLVDAAAQLRTYETLHRAKNTEESTAKAEVNAALAARFEATIASARGES